jgi:beta-lactamase superfamily II metal-dependent hydrolase
MPKVTFFPLGNADCCLVDLQGSQKLLFDFANQRDPNNPADLRIDLPGALLNNLKEAHRDYFDVVAFTHLDADHIQGVSQFLYLEYAKQYQGPGRVKAKTLWVPAAVIIEESCEDEARIIQKEARYRLKEGKGIRVFSRPEKLKEWLEEQGLSLEERKHLITDAGQVAPDFSKLIHGVEFFVHSPFASRLADGTLLDRNSDSLVLQATFVVEGKETRLMLAADVDHTVLTSIVEVTKYHEREARLAWDVFKLPHHCSYLSLAPEKGKEKTEPVPEVKWLFEQGQPGGIIVSTSKPIPSDDRDPQPPHRQAAAYYKERMKAIGGEFIVTMEHPKPSAPRPLVINIDRWKATIEKGNLSGAAAIISRPAPRAG